jgi:hypothetical protein
MLPPSAVNEQLPGNDHRFRLSLPHPEAPRRGVKGLPTTEIPESARHEHDKKRENSGGYPPSGHKNPEQLYPVLSDPRKQDFKASPPGENENMENWSWICACI